MSKEIKLKVKLCAYTKDILPRNLIGEVPKEPIDHIYARAYGKWIDLGTTDIGQVVKLAEKSGLNLIPTENPKEYLLSIRQEVLKELPIVLEDDTTYYILDRTPEIYINGGTSYSDGVEELTINEYQYKIFGGKASTTSFDLNLLPIDNKGVYNGN